MTVTETVPRTVGLAAAWGQRHPRIVDVLVASAWILLAAPSLLLARSSPSFGWGAAIAFSAATLIVAFSLFAFRRSRPLLAFLISFTVTLPLFLVSPDVPNLAAAFCVFAVGVYDSARRARLAAAASATVTILAAALFIIVRPPLTVPELAPTPVGDVIAYTITGLLFLLVALLWGQNTGNRRRYIESLLEHARHLERERDQQAQLAALAERSRIARDVHDIVSHSLSVIVRLADGANAVFDQQPERAKDAIAQLGGVARSSLTEMRRVIGVLESTPGSASAQAGTGFDDLPRLVEVYQGIGLPVVLTISGEKPPQPGVQVTVFRVVQEALTNALRHASTPSTVTVDVETDDDVTVTVKNDGAPLAALSDDHVGRGLVGMHERAALYGGTLAAGPDGTGRWTVKLHLPGAGS